MKSKKLILVSMLCVVIFALVIVLLAVEPTLAVGPLYVAPGGTDSGDCTNSASPCATIQYAVGVATAGDEIRVATGTYTGTGSAKSWGWLIGGGGMLVVIVVGGILWRWRVKRV